MNKCCTFYQQDERAWRFICYSAKHKDIFYIFFTKKGLIAQKEFISFIQLKDKYVFNCFNMANTYLVDRTSLCGLFLPVPATSTY